MLRRFVLPFLAVAWIVGIALAGARSGRPVDDARVPLPIEKATVLGFGGNVHLVVECATDVTVTVGKDHGGSALAEVTVWGRPKVGRCHPDEASIGGGVHNGLPPGPDGSSQQKFVDGATSQVVTIS